MQSNSRRPGFGAIPTATASKADARLDSSRTSSHIRFDAALPVAVAILYSRSS